MPKTLHHFIKKEVGPWSTSTFLIALLLIVPLTVVLSGLFRAGPKWDHVASTVLGTYVSNTAILIVTVSLLCIAFAVLPAWLVSIFDFPGRKIFEWALVLPLAIPTYVAAFVYYSIPEQAIPLLIEIRSYFGVDVYIAAEKVMRYGLLSVIMAGVLFPYLYISVRTSFSQQRRAAIEAAQMLGRGPRSVFLTVALPLSRPAMVAGLGLILMEVINDYGAVNFFGVPTLTEGIFRTWFGLSDRSSAMRIAGLMMLVVFLFLGLERFQRGNATFGELNRVSAPIARKKMRRSTGILAFLLCLIPLAIGFIIPMIQLIKWTAMTWHEVLDRDFIGHLINSLFLSLLTAFGISALALFFCYHLKLNSGKPYRFITRCATIGYAVPGAVVAVGVMVSLAAIDRLDLPFLLSGSLFAIIFAYAIRFLTVAYEPVKAGMSKVCGNLNEASRLLGEAPLPTLWKIDLPILRGTLLGAAMLVFVDILKELPLTMILRPANFETLATTAFGLAKEGRIYQCAVPSLLIVIAGGAGLLILNRYMRRD